MMLYQLARNIHIRNAVFQDLKETDMKPGRIPPLLCACLKETLRLHPTANSRILNADAVLSSYRVPKRVSMDSGSQDSVESFCSM